MILVTNFISIVLVTTEKEIILLKLILKDLFPNLICWRKRITLKVVDCIPNSVVKYWPIFASVLMLSSKR